MSWAVGFLVGALVLALARRLPAYGVPPRLGIALSGAVLLLRASLSTSFAAVCVYYLPTTDTFEAVVRWCGHAGLPWSNASTHLSLVDLGNAATIFPGLLLIASGAFTVYSLWWGSRAAHEWIISNALGDGPRESLIVGGAGIFFAAAGVRSPRIVVSTGALLTLEDAELEAGLEHERAHIVRRHPLLRAAGEGLGALGCLLPGAQRAQSALRFHLERDADELAVRRTGDPAALASAICKSAASVGERPLAMWLDGEGAPYRLRALLERDARPALFDLSMGAAAVVVTTTLAMLLALSIPLLLQGGTGHLAAGSAYACYA